MVSRRSRIITIIILSISFLSIVSYFLFTYNAKNKANTDTLNQNPVIQDSKEDFLDMTLEEKVGQLFIFGFWGTEPDYYITKMISERYIGGVILLGYNLESPKQIRKLTSDLQSLSKTPLFISIDQEGGTVSRLKPPIVSDDTAQKEIKDEADAYNVAYTRGLELKVLGINMNFSPVVDNITNENSFLYDRVFRDDITLLANGMVNGYSDAKVIPVIKHFPGHGNESKDPHDVLSVVNLERKDLESYLKDFKVVFENKNSHAVMIGHILAPKISSDPASLSKIFVTDILREDLKFKGISITDDIQMKALTKSYSIQEATLKALLAGNDILMFTGVPEQQAEAYEAVLNGVRDGSISEEFIDEKVRRILDLKSLFEL